MKVPVLIVEQNLLVRDQIEATAAKEGLRRGVDYEFVGGSSDHAAFEVDGVKMIYVGEKVDGSVELFDQLRHVRELRPDVKIATSSQELREEKGGFCNLHIHGGGWPHFHRNGHWGYLVDVMKSYPNHEPAESAA